MKPLPLVASAFVRYRPKPGRIAMPDVTCHLIWAKGCLQLIGPMSRARLSSFVGDEVQLLVIAPDVARRHFGVPLCHLTDQMLPLDAIDRDAANRLTAWFVEEHAHVLVGPPSAAAHPDDLRTAAATAGLRRGMRVNDVAAKVCLSERQLERSFADQIGPSPRSYQQIVRFRAAISAIKTGDRVSEASARAGFADQPHFNRTTRALTGTTPTALVPHVGNVQDIVVGRHE